MSPTDGRPLWFLVPGRGPMKHEKKPIKDATHYCREGDDHWTPLEQAKPVAAP